MFRLNGLSGSEEPDKGVRGQNSSGSQAVGKLFRHVAFWQAMAFMMLICVVWVLQFADIGSEAALESLYLSGCISLVGFITVAHTFVQQRRVLEGLVISCSYCRRIRIKGANWQHLESYLAKRIHARFSHGICPDCLVKATEEPDQLVDLSTIKTDRYSY